MQMDIFKNVRWRGHFGASWSSTSQMRFSIIADDIQNGARVRGPGAHTGKNAPWSSQCQHAATCDKNSYCGVSRWTFFLTGA
jgi:hypothetical protein